MARLLGEAGCDVLAELEDGLSLLEWMACHPGTVVDVLFLDIQMPGLNGLETLAELKNPPVAVFVTAYSNYAIQAFEAAAVDYLLKPVYEDRLAKTLQRVRDLQVRQLSTAEWKAMLPPFQRISIRAGSGHVLLDFNQATHFELIDERVWAITPTHRHQTGWTTLRDVEQTFPEAGMVRIQRNLLLRPETVVGYKNLPGGRLRVRLPKGLELVVSRSMASAFKARLSLK